MAGANVTWVPFSRGSYLFSGAVMSGHTSDGDMYVGRNGKGEVGKVTFHNGVMKSIFCHKDGESEVCELLVLQPGTRYEWRAYKHSDAVPDDAVWAGVTTTDGKHGVFVARERHGTPGKLNLTDDGFLCNLWVSGAWTAWKEGEILLVHDSSYTGPPSFGVPMPTNPLSLSMWNPNANCDGKIAEDRCKWLQENKGINKETAQFEVMREFPKQFGGGAQALMGYGGGGGGGAGVGPQWNPKANCEGQSAEERSVWLQQNKGLTTDAARQQLMREFPAQFPRWRPEADCEGKPAQERVTWLTKNQGLDIEAARLQVMNEFPAMFR